MALLIAAAVLCSLAVGLALGLVLSGRFSRNGRALRATRAELRRHQQFVEKTRALAWDHRELDPHLSTVLVDEIHTFTKNTPLEIS